MAKERGILLDTETKDLAINVIRDASGKITQGIQLGNVTQQNVASILVAQAGEFKEHPLVGIGIDNILLGKDSLSYKHKIREQLGLEGLEIKTLNITEEDIVIDARYR